MPFTALKPLSSVSYSANSNGSCAPPNAVYGIETAQFLHLLVESFGCAPPNAVYGIETA